MKKKDRLLTYEELLTQHPEHVLWDVAVYHREETAEATLRSKQEARARIGHVIDFLQKQGLMRGIVFPNAPDVPDDARVYLRGVHPDCLDFYREVYIPWIRRLTIHSDSSDMSSLSSELRKLKSRSSQG